MTADRRRAHRVELTYQHAWGEWLPKCSCGWIGSYVVAKAAAEREAERHCQGDAR